MLHLVLQILKLVTSCEGQRTQGSSRGLPLYIFCQPWYLVGDFQDSLHLECFSTMSLGIGYGSM